MVKKARKKLQSDDLLNLLLDNESIDLDRDNIPLSSQRKERVLYVNALLDQVKHDKRRRELHPPSADEIPHGVIRSCRKCYFCNFVRTVGVEWYVYCSHPSRTGQNKFLKAGINLDCWRPPTK